MTEAAAESAAVAEVTRWICDECHARGEFLLTDVDPVTDGVDGVSLFVSAEHVKSSPECFATSARVLYSLTDGRIRSEDIHV